MTFFEKLKQLAENAISGVINIPGALEERKLRKKYPDYHGKTAHDVGLCKFIWGIKSKNDHSNDDIPSFETKNDIQIIYFRETKDYVLTFDTSGWHKDNTDEARYMLGLLHEFTRYMVDNKLPIDEPYKFWMSPSFLAFMGKTLPEVYTNFRAFVMGHYALYHEDAPNPDVWSTEEGITIMKLLFKKLDERAVVPTYGTEYSAGADLRAIIDEPMTIIKPGESALIHTGIAVAIPAGYVGLVYARSGIASKRGLAPSNKVGVIDADYRGEIMVSLHNHSNVDQSIAPGERIAQMVITPFIHCEYEEVEVLDDTERGAGGFGSTGAK